MLRLVSIFVVVSLLAFPATAQDKYKSQQVKVGDASLVDGYCIDYPGMAFLLLAPETEKKKCLLEKEEIRAIDKIETEKVLKQIEAEYKKKLEMCELMACNKKQVDKTPYGWKWVAGSAMVGVLVGVVSVLAIQNFR
jgi:hypothetical protein